jgi:hypothetical protein
MRSVSCLTLASLWIACANSKGLPAGKDAEPDLGTPSPDVAPDTPSPDLPAPDAPGDLGRDTTPDIPSGPEAGSADGPGADGAQACYWQKPGGGWALPHFTFLLTTPDGKAQTPPSGMPMLDAGSPWPINDFEGLIVSNSGNQLVVDSCDPTLPCQSALYRFTLCAGSPCAAASSPASVEVPIPVGRRVRVVWHLDNYTVFCRGLYWLAIYDAEVGGAPGNLLFLGSGGRQPSTATSSNGYFNTLPFSVSLRPLLCGGSQRDGGFFIGDDYAFVFTSSTSVGATLELQTGQSGTFTFAAPSRKPERLLIHCLDAVQPNHTDDYWNWDFWATGETLSNPRDAAVASPLDAGGG